MKTALFRCDASKDIGTGHVVRCLTLANEFKKRNWDCFFAVSEKTLAIVSELGTSGHKIIMAHSPGYTSEKFDLLIFDHYGIDTTEESKFRKKTSCIAVIDDLANRQHNCDFLLDQTHGRDPQDYNKLVPNHCKILTGAKFALLRPQFPNAHTNSIQNKPTDKNKTKKIFVLISRTDPDDVSLKVLKALDNFSDISIDLVLGKVAAERMDINALINCRPNIKLHVDIDDIASLMANADVAIGAGGTTSWERCCMGLPSIIIEIADNQKLISQNLDEAGAAINLGWHSQVSTDNISQTLEELLNNPARMMKMRDKARSICDGNGAQRVVQELIDTYANTKSVPHS